MSGKIAFDPFFFYSNLYIQIRTLSQVKHNIKCIQSVYRSGNATQNEQSIVYYLYIIPTVHKSGWRLIAFIVILALTILRTLYKAFY